MKRKLLLAVTSAFLLHSMITGQTKTYSVELSKISSDKYDEYSPVYYKKGIVYCSNRNTSFLLNYLTSDNKGLSKIMFIDSTRLKTSHKSKLLSKELKTKFNDGPASFSKDGDTIYFSRNLKVEGSVRENSVQRNKLGIFTAVAQWKKWMNIRDLRFNNEYYNITTPTISQDGKSLYFASDNPAGLGGSDLYVSHLRGDFWDDPVNLGPQINTSGNESFPFVNSEGGLFFSSDGLPGSGGKDIFYTKQVDGKWLKPVALDEPVNSVYDDFGFTADSVMNQGFFSSRRTGKTVDIYHFRTNIHQLFFCDNERVNQYCFKFNDEEKIPVDNRFFQLVWNFGDGGNATGPAVEHCFPGQGKYQVRLDVIDKNSGKVFFSKLSYNLDLRDIEQPIITSPSTLMKGSPTSFDGLASTFRGSKILDYTWDFGDGTRAGGSRLNHEYLTKGDYVVKLGIIVRNEKTGVIQQACVMKPLKVFDDKQLKADFDSKVTKPASRPNIKDYDHATISDLISVEKDFNQDIVFGVEITSAKLRLNSDNSLFRNVPSKYTIREMYFPEKKVYSYVVDEEMSLMATYPTFSEMMNLGFSSVRVITYIPDNPATRELNNLKRVFGLSADNYFRKNDFNLTSAGTQTLDLILGFLSKYPNLKLELSAYTDNQGNQAANLLLTQKRADAMVNYLTMNGVSPLRLVAKGYGSTRPVAPNISESDRKLNRRVDFTIIKE